jgi:hypothetical protein
MALIKLSKFFSSKSKYVRIACQGLLRTNNFKIENNEIVIEIDEFILALNDLKDEENKNMKG